MGINTPLREQQEIEQLACDFFILFSKFEYALKQLGHFKAYSVKDPRVTLQWSDFEKRKEVKAALDAAPKDVQNAINFLVKTPACRQIVKNGKVTWEDRPNPDTKTVIEVIKTVRNNLCHGGKYDGQWAPPFAQGSGSKQHLKNSITVLNHIRDKSVWSDLNELIDKAHL